MRYLLFAVLLAAACRKAPMYEDKKQSEAAPAQAAPAPVQEHVDANPVQGAALIRKAQDAAAKADGQVQQEQKTDVPQQ